MRPLILLIAVSCLLQPVAYSQIMTIPLVEKQDPSKQGTVPEMPHQFQALMLAQQGQYKEAERGSSALV